MDVSRTRALLSKLEKHEACISSSDLFSHTSALLGPLDFTSIRCLALGSPTQEFQAMYQLAYLRLIAEKFEIAPNDVSLYDPAFSPDDTSFLTTELHYVVENAETYSNGKHAKNTKNTLFYMPHAPRSLTEEIMGNLCPLMFLANDFSVTMGTLTKAKFLQEYPNLATLVHFTEKSNGHKSAKPDDGFAPVSRRKRRPKKNVYVEPELVYEDSKYFSGAEITRIKSDPDAVWKDSFSDLALNVIIPRVQEKDTSEEKDNSTFL